MKSIPPPRRWRALGALGLAAAISVLLGACRSLPGGPGEPASPGGRRPSYEVAVDTRCQLSF